MYKLEDIPKEIIEGLAKYRGLRKKNINVVFTPYRELIEQIKQEYDFDDIDLAQHIRRQLPFEKHFCVVCGKHLHYNQHYRKFATVCSNKCAGQCTSTQVNRTKTFMDKYGTLAIMHIPQIREKVKKANKERYGEEYYWRSKDFRDKFLKSKGIKDFKRRRKDDSYENLILLHPEVTPLFSKEDYQGVKKVYKFKCNNCGREFEKNYTVKNIAYLCPFCHPKSLQQSDLNSFISDICIQKGYNILTNTHDIITPLELDIYIPELKLAFEYNGNFWHSSERLTPSYHLNKTKLCEEKGIHLVHIFEYEWIQKNELIKQRLRSLLSITDKKIYARKCEIKSIEDIQVVKDFLNTHHLQQYCTSAINLGLYYKDELVALMTFGKPRFNKEHEWELLRFCSKYTIIGGADKLLKYFERKYNPTSLISYANRCWSSKLGNVYSKLGFNLISESEPNYLYIKKDNKPNQQDKPLSRYQCQKHKLKALLGDENFDNTKSETENMYANGYVKLHDCGNLVYSKLYK